MRYVLILALALAGCSGDFAGGDDSQQTDAGTPSDGGTSGCIVAYDPMGPVASSVLPIRAFINANIVGFPTYQWSVYFGSTMVPFTPAASDNSQISFIAATAGVYTVQVEITGASMCPFASTTINVGAPGANTDTFRLRTVPRAGEAPPQETLLYVKGGADATRAIALDSGVAVTGVVINSVTNAGVPAYLKFIPNSVPSSFAFSEQFSTSSGGYSLPLMALDHKVLVIPGVAGLAPKLVDWELMPMTQTLAVGPGTLVTGTVRNPAGNGFGGAKVQLYSGGVPSTLATTAADGSFSVRTDFPTTTNQVTVKVTPPAGSGLPRLEATSAFNLAAALNINYAPGLTTCDLTGVPVRRAAANQANAQVSIVGSLATVAGTIAGINATNTVRVTATANGSGVLPSLLVPRGSLFAVTEVPVPADSMGDHAVTAINTSTCSVAQIDAPAMTTISGTTKKADGTAIGGVRVEAELTGVLALAGVAPVQITSTSTGAFTLPLAGAGRYNVRFSDPQQRAAPLVAADVAPAGVPTNALLVKALTISGTVSFLQNSNPVIGASVQLLCATCSGLETARPIAETATDSVSKYRIAVPDPGTM